MVPELIEAWLIHYIPYGETSLQLIFFSREKGIVSCLYRGGRLLKKHSLIQSFTALTVTIQEAHNRFYVKHLELRAMPLFFPGTLLFSALYLNELLYYVIPYGENESNLFDLYVSSLSALSQTTQTTQIEIILRVFELKILEVAGQALCFNDPLKSNIDSQAYYKFIPGHGFEQSAQGTVLAWVLVAILQREFTDPLVLKTAKLILRSAIDYLLEGRELKSRALWLKIKKHSD